MAVSTADSSCLRMLIRIMTGSLQIIPMRILGISGRRGCTQSLLLTYLRQTSNLCLATTHVSILEVGLLTCTTSFILPELHFFLSNLDFCLRSGWDAGFRRRGAFSLYMNFVSIFFNFACLFGFSNFCPSIA